MESLDTQLCVKCIIKKYDTSSEVKTLSRPDATARQRIRALKKKPIPCNRTDTTPCDYCITNGFECMLPRKASPSEVTDEAQQNGKTKQISKKRKMNSFLFYDTRLTPMRVLSKATLLSNLENWMNQIPRGLDTRVSLTSQSNRRKNQVYKFPRPPSQFVPIELYDLPFMEYSTWDFDPIRYNQLLAIEGTHEMNERDSTNIDPVDHPDLKELTSMKRDIQNRLGVPSSELFKYIVRLIDSLIGDSSTPDGLSLKWFSPDALLGIGLLAQELLFQESYEHEGQLLTSEQVAFGPTILDIVQGAGSQRITPIAPQPQVVPPVQDAAISCDEEEI